MIKTKDNFFFGFVEGMPYQIISDSVEDMEQNTASMPRKRIKEYLEKLEDVWAATTWSTDIYTG